MADRVTKATCKCGEVEFELLGSGPIFACSCCCNDCVAASYYIDENAKNAGTENISSFEPGSRQSSLSCMWPRSGIRLTKGKDKIRKFRLRPISKSIHTYASCCNTIVLKTCGKHWPHIALGATFNLNTVSPPIEAKYRILTKELVHPDQTPKNQSISDYSGIPLVMICQILPYMVQSFLGCNRCVDEDALEFIDSDWVDVPEVAGRASYEACGFKNVKMENTR